MNTACEHPWQNGPHELFQFALDALQANNDISQRIAFLLFDVCIETALRTYLSLPDGTIDSQLKHSERRKYATGNFHDLTKGIGLSAQPRIRDVDLHHLKFYHGIRNRLYHEGNGITVRSDHVRGYATLATTLLKQLLDIDCTHAFQTLFKQDTSLNPNQDAFLALKKELPGDIERFKLLITQLMETLEPRMIYPSTIRRLSEIASTIDVSSFPRKLGEFRELLGSNIKDQELRSWLLHFIADDLNWDGPQVISNTQFLMELGKDHISFYSFIIGIRLLPIGDVRKDTLDRYEDLSFVAQDEYSITGVYDSCLCFEQFFRQKKGIVLNDTPALERSLELQKKLRVVIKRLEGLMQA